MIDADGIEWLTYTEAAKRFQIPAATIRSWVRRGVIHPLDVVRAGRRVAVCASAIRRAELHLRTHGKKLAAGHRRGAVRASA